MAGRMVHPATRRTRQRRNNHPPTRRLNMTIVYVPRLIESAEQAEALPIGTVAIDLDSQGQPRQASIRVRCGWYCTGEVEADGSPWLAPHDVMAGDYALAPIEAEEETREHPYRDEEDPDSPYLRPIQQTRYVTPWEEA